MKNRKFWKWTNQAAASPSAERVLELYGTIASETWFDDDVTPQMFRDELFAGDGPITIWVNSPGGDCTAASQIYSMLMDYKNDVTVKIDGIAASAASVVAMAGTKVLMSPTAMMMIHNPATGAFGDHVDMEKAIKMLDEVKESIINAYAAKSGLSHARIANLMSNETWMNAKKAIELGFADGMLTDEKHIVETEAYAFSGSSVEKALLNKISAKAKRQTPEKKPMTVKADDCLERLNLIKNWR